MRVVDTWHNKDRTRSARYGQGSRWMAVWSPAPGAEKKKVFKTKDAAKAHLEQVTAAKALGKVGPARDRPFDEYAETWLKRQSHQRSASVSVMTTNVRIHLVPFFESVMLRDLERGQVQDLVSHLKARKAPATIRSVYRTLAAIMSDAVLDKILPASPCVKIRLPEESEPLVPPTPGMVERVAHSLPGVYQQVAVFTAATGLRSGEWRGLTVDRVDLSERILRVDRQNLQTVIGAPSFGPLKTKFSYRELAFGEATASVLESLVKNPGPSGLVFHSGGSGITRTQTTQAWRKARRAVPAAGRGWHQLRHFHASQLIAAGASPVAVAHRLGHKDANETFRTYGHLWPDDDRKLALLSDGLVRLDRHETATG